MLKLESQDVVGQTAYWEDDADPLQYYALPGEPTLAIRTGKPVFKYVKYRSPIIGWGEHSEVDHDTDACPVCRDGLA